MVLTEGDGSVKKNIKKMRKERKERKKKSNQCFVEEVLQEI
jgi:hypothetical protein